MELRCERCTLRTFQPADAEVLAVHADNHAIWRNLRDRFPRPFVRADAEGYIARVARQSPPTSFAIDVDGLAVGSVSLHVGTDVERLSAEIGYWLGEPYWGRGITSDAVRAATQYAFGELALARVFAVPFARNAASARVLEKAGYQYEGRLRRSAVKEGELLDQYMYAAVRD
jgi:RimJ/RimL family protein N-acetyltransferase